MLKNNKKEIKNRIIDVLFYSSKENSNLNLILNKDLLLNNKEIVEEIIKEKNILNHDVLDYLLSNDFNFPLEKITLSKWDINFSTAKNIIKILEKESDEDLISISYFNCLYNKNYLLIDQFNNNQNLFKKVNMVKALDYIKKDKNLNVHDLVVFSSISNAFDQNTFDFILNQIIDYKELININKKYYLETVINNKYNLFISSKIIDERKKDIIDFYNSHLPKSKAVKSISQMLINQSNVNYLDFIIEKYGKLEFLNAIKKMPENNFIVEAIHSKIIKDVKNKDNYKFIKIIKDNNVLFNKKHIAELLFKLEEKKTYRTNIVNFLKNFDMDIQFSDGTILADNIKKFLTEKEYIKISKKVLTNAVNDDLKEKKTTSKRKM